MSLVLVVTPLAIGTAAAGDTIGVLHVKTVGVTAVAVQKFETSLEEGLAGGSSFKLVPRAQLVQKLAAQSKVTQDPGCRFGPCLKGIYQQTKIPLVLVARITKIGPSYSFIISLLDTRSGNPTAQVTPGCEVCTLDEAILTATMAVIELMTDKSAATDPELGATAHVTPVQLRGSLDTLHNSWSARRRHWRIAGYLFLAGAVAAGGAAAALVSKDKKLGYGAGGLSGAFALSATTMLVLSRSF